MRIAYQGVAGAYSHIASMTVYPGQEYLPCDTFEKAMKLVSEGEADLAMIPVENSNAGRVSDVHFLLPQTGLHIIGEFFLPINHQLLGLPGTKLADVKSASSHPQALAQCSEFLKRHGIKPTARIDTALSCQHDPFSDYGAGTGNSRRRRRRVYHIFHIQGQKYSGGIVQGAGRLCHKWHQHYKTGELSAGREVCFGAVLCRDRIASVKKSFSECL